MSTNFIDLFFVTQKYDQKKLIQKWTKNEEHFLDTEGINYKFHLYKSIKL